MKVLKDNYNKTMQNKPYPRQIVCEGCQSELEYNETDLQMGSYGVMHLQCPLCGEDNMLDDNENNIILTVDNIEFPLHFHHISKELKAVDICDNEHIKECLHNAVNYFRKNKEEFSWSTWCGNMYVCVHRYPVDELYEITISNNFYNMDIPFEAEDY